MEEEEDVDNEASDLLSTSLVEDLGFKRAGGWQANPTGGGVEWSGVEWSGVEWSGVEWSGVEWSGVEWSGVEWSGVRYEPVEQHRKESKNSPTCGNSKQLARRWMAPKKLLKAVLNSLRSFWVDKRVLHCS